ncbi:MAG: tetratricopeptide repeat protein [Sedimenticola sp.]|nr:tetratricopeptide repeat protein [Sedimenticola sp.]
MAETSYRLLLRLAVMLTLAWIGWTLYDGPLRDTAPGVQTLAAAARHLEDGEYREALVGYRQVLQAEPENGGALRGEAQALMRLGIRQMREAISLRAGGDGMGAKALEKQAEEHLHNALQGYNKAIEYEKAAQAEPRSLGVAHANRGILRDQTGDYPGALADYREALRLAPGLADGPGLLTRFLRNQAQRPPSIADRADYLAGQLAKPESERLMRVPEEDAQQRAYTLD